MYIIIRAKTLFGILCLTIFAVGGIIVTGNRTLVPVFSPAGTEDLTGYYIIDAGHGGEDGGAVAADGTLESTLNLSIAQRTQCLFSFLGKPTAMTRSNEDAVYSAGASTLREKKRSDLKNRVAMIEGYSGPILISIHQNSLPSSAVTRGAQVFYNRSDASPALAASTQKALNITVNAGNEKAEKQIDPSIYLMRQITCPGILIECGFLSNSEETKELQDGAYQTKLAVAIVAGVLNNSNGAESNESE